MIEYKNKKMKELVELSKDVKGIAEDFNTELVMQDKQIVGVEKNMDDGHEKVMGAKAQLEKALEKSKAQNKRMGIMCFALFVIVVAIFLMLFGNPFKSDEIKVLPDESTSSSESDTTKSSTASTNSTTEAFTKLERLQEMAKKQ